MTNPLVSVRLPAADLATIDFVAARSGAERSDWIRAALARGLADELRTMGEEIERGAQRRDTLGVGTPSSTAQAA